MDIPDDLIGDVVAPHFLEGFMMMPEETGLVSEEPLLPTTDPTAAHPVVGNICDTTDTMIEHDTVLAEVDVDGEESNEDTSTMIELSLELDQTETKDEPFVHWLWKQADAPCLKLLTLPIDSLHCIASFVTASDWASVGLTTTIATPICRDVFQRVRMHGFRCATEVVTAWVSSACVQIHSV